MSMMKELNMEALDKVVGGVEDPILKITVNYEDAGGKKYGFTIDNRKVSLDDLIGPQTVTYQDGNGHTFTTTTK